MRKIMPCKLLASVVLLAILLIIPTFVDAYSGEIDPKNYISLPVYKTYGIFCKLCFSLKTLYIGPP